MFEPAIAAGLLLSPLGHHHRANSHSFSPSG